MDFWNSLIVFLGSLLAGFLGGQVGGAGLLTLPILLFIGVNPLVALGTNRFSSIFLTFISAIAFYRQKKIVIKHYLTFGFVALFGGTLGSIIINNLNFDSNLLKQFIVIVLFCVVIVLFFQRNLGLVESELKLVGKHHALFLFLIFLVSIYGGILGAAMSTFFAILFTLKKQSFVQAMSYALFLSFIICVSSTVTFIVSGHIHYLYAILQAIGGGFGSYFGSKYAIKKGNLWIKNFMIIMVLAFLVKLFFEVY